MLSKEHGASTGSSTRRPVATKYTKARRADERDEEVGRRVRAQRNVKGLSQTELGDKIGVTFQQVQKYEKGTNRIGSGRLQRIAEALEVPVSFFFDKQPARSDGEDGSVLGLLNTSGAARLLRAYAKIGRGERQNLVTMAENLARKSK